MDHGQFYHFEIYGRKKSKAKIKMNSSLYSVLGEAFREPEYSSHVDINDTEKFPPKIIYGMEFDDDTISDNEKLKIQKEQLIEMAEKYAKAKGLRQVDGCILAGVVSYPPGTTLEMLPALQQLLVLPFLIKKFGKNLRCVISHKDEYFWDDEEKRKKPHYQDHFFVIMDADDKERLTSLHAGVIAKRKAIAGKAGKDGKKHSDMYYREAMSKEQDEFFAEVGEKAGWKRITVNGVHYTREEVKKWKKNQKENKQKITETQNECERIKKNAEEEGSNITTKAENEAHIIISNAETYASNVKEEAEKAAIQLIETVSNDMKKAKEAADKIKNEARVEADNIIKKAEERKNDIIDSSWRSAKSIYDASMKRSYSIIDNARGFVDNLLKAISKLPGSNSIIRWAKTFIKTKSTDNKKTVQESLNSNNKKRGRKI